VSDKNVKVAEDTIGVETKPQRASSLEDDVEVYVPEAEEEIVGETIEDVIERNKIKASAHAAGVRAVSPEEIFERRMKLTGGTSPAEAGAAVVLLKEDPEGKMKRDKRRERNGIWTQKFFDWVKKQGKEVRSAGGELKGVGDRIEVTPNGHYRYKW